MSGFRFSIRRIIYACAACILGPKSSADIGTAGYEKRCEFGGKDCVRMRIWVCVKIGTNGGSPPKRKKEKRTKFPLRFPLQSPSQRGPANVGTVKMCHQPTKPTDQVQTIAMSAIRFPWLRHATNDLSMLKANNWPRHRTRC